MYLPSSAFWTLTDMFFRHVIVEDSIRYVIVFTRFQVPFGEYDRAMGGRMVPVSDAKTSNMECQSSPHQNTQLDKLIYWPGYRQRRTLHHATLEQNGLGFDGMFASFCLLVRLLTSSYINTLLCVHWEIFTSCPSSTIGLYVS